jgi:hypothetical protein
MVKVKVKVAYRWVSLIYAKMHCCRVSERPNGNEENAYLLECGGMLLRCLGLHPIQKRPSSLINALTSILDGKRRLCSCLTCLVLSEPMALNAAMTERYFCICQESRPALLRKVWLRCHARDVFNLAVAFVRMGNLWHGPVTRRLPELRDLEGTEHDEDGAPALDGTDGARRV